MTSKTAEDIHLAMLNKLLSESGLECARSLSVSEETSTLTGEEEQICPEEEEQLPPEEHPPEEELPPPEEEVPQDQPYLFPTPSLRKVLPDRVRKLEEFNRMHVLPEEFKTDIDPALIPKIAWTTQQKYIDILAELVGCTKYKSSLAEFWFLDTLANLLRRAQDDDMNRPTQAILIKWFCEWMKEMQYFDAADRKRMMRRFKDNMLAAAKFIAAKEQLPAPLDAEVHYKALDDSPKTEVSPTPRSRSYAPTDHTTVTFEGANYECSLMDLCKIIHYIYDLFSTDYQYDLVRSIFTTTPEYSLIDAPYQIQNPKRLYAPMKIKPPKKDKSPIKKEPEKEKKSRHQIITHEYLALMALRAKDERDQEELEELDRETWHRRCHILPLNQAADDALFDKYWPPPPPEPLPEPKVEDKGKGKGKGKKK